MFEKAETQEERKARLERTHALHHTAAILALAETPPNYPQAVVSIRKAQGTRALLENRADAIPPEVTLAMAVVDGLTLGTGCHTGRRPEGVWAWHNRAVYVTPEAADAAFKLLGQEPIPDPLFQTPTGDDDGTE